MAIRDSLLPEFDHETGTTRRLLERLPEERFGWKPHQKSMSLGRLATHVAELTSWGSLALSATEFNMPAGPYQPVEKATRDEVLGLFDENVAALRRQLENISDGELMVMWTFKSGGQPVFSQPRIGVLRIHGDESPDSPPRPAERLPAAERRPAAVDLRAVGRRERVRSWLVASGDRPRPATSH